MARTGKFRCALLMRNAFKQIEDQALVHDHPKTSPFSGGTGETALASLATLSAALRGSSQEPYAPC